MSVQLAGSVPMQPEWQVEFSLDYGVTTVKAKARTVWHKDTLLGMRFVEFEAHCRDQLLRWLGETYYPRRSLDCGRTEVPAPTAPQKINNPVAFEITDRPLEFAYEEDLVANCRRSKCHMLGNYLASAFRCMGTQLASELLRGWKWAQTPVRKILQQWVRDRTLGLQAELARKRVAIITAANHAVFQPWPHHIFRYGRISKAWHRGTTMATSGAAMLISGAVLVILLGFASYAYRRPASPLSRGALLTNGSVKQEIPFGAAIVTAPLAVLPKPSPIMVGKTLTGVHPEAQKTRQSERTGRRHRPQSQDDWLAEDEVVVRHFQAPQPQQPRPLAAAPVETSSATVQQTSKNRGNASVPEAGVGRSRSTTRWQKMKSWLRILKHHDGSSPSS